MIQFNGIVINWISIFTNSRSFRNWLIDILEVRNYSEYFHQFIVCNNRIIEFDSNSKDWIVFRIFVKKKSERKLREFYLIKFSKHEMNIARATKYLVQVDNLRKLRREEEGSKFWMLQHNLCFVIFVCYYVCRRMLRFRFVTRLRTLDSSKYVFSCIFLSFSLLQVSFSTSHERGYGSDI